MVMINIQFVFAFIGAAVGIIIGIMVFGQIATAVECPGSIGYTNTLGVTITSENMNQYRVIKDSATQSGGQTVGELVDAPSTTNAGTKGQTTPYTMGSDQYNPGKSECDSSKQTAWTVLGILPITLFFVLFSISGAFGRQE